MKMGTVLVLFTFVPVARAWHVEVAWSTLEDHVVL